MSLGEDDQSKQQSWCLRTSGAVYLIVGHVALFDFFLTISGTSEPVTEVCTGGRVVLVTFRGLLGAADDGGLGVVTPSGLGRRM